MYPMRPESLSQQQRLTLKHDTLGDIIHPMMLMWSRKGGIDV